MRVAMFGTRAYEREVFEQANKEHGHDLNMLEPTLCHRTAPLAEDHPAVCAFVNDRLGRRVLKILHEGGTRLIALRSAGFNNVDLEAADEFDMTVTRVPAYSPHAVAEHAIALILALNRKLHRSVSRVREQNFSLEGLVGFDLHGKTIGIVGTGKIGSTVAKIMHGFGCHLLGHDKYENSDCMALGLKYVDLPEIARKSDIITLHCPLTPETHRMIDATFLESVRPGLMLINTSRGPLVETRAVIGALKDGRLGSLGIDVYEEEGDLFFQDLSGEIIHDDIFARLLTFPNVIITAHQAFLTREAIASIAQTTLKNITDFEQGTIEDKNRVTLEHVST